MNREQSMQKEHRGLGSVEFDESQSIQSEGNDNVWDDLGTDNE